MDQRAAECELLFHTAGKLSRTACAERFDLAIDRRDQIVVLRDLHPEQRRKESEVLPHRQVGIERKPSGHVAYPLADALVVVHDIQPVDRGCAAVGCDERRKQPEKRRLAGSVGTDQAEQLAPPDLERHLVECREDTVTFGQGVNLYGIPHRRRT